MDELSIFTRIKMIDEQRRELATKRIALEARIRRLQEADKRGLAEICRLNDLLKTAENERQAAFDATNAKHPLPISGKN